MKSGPHKEEKGGGWNKGDFQENLKSACKGHAHGGRQGSLSGYMISLVTWFLGKNGSAKENTFRTESTNKVKFG